MRSVNPLLLLFLLLNQPISSEIIEYSKTSWYGDPFHGRLTASGEVFDKNAFTAAAPNLEFDSQYNLCYNTKCVEIRINDRGPYHSDRDLDVSEAVATKLGFKEKGVVVTTMTRLN